MAICPMACGETENLLLSDCAKEPLYARAYKYLNMLDREFDAIRNGSLESLGEDRHPPDSGQSIIVGNTKLRWLGFIPSFER